MKRLLLLIIIVTIFTFIGAVELKSRSLEIVFCDTLLKGGVEDRLKSFAQIKNITKEPKNILVKVIIDDIQPGHKIYLCVMISTYQPTDTDYVISRYFTLQPDSTLRYGDFFATLLSNKIPGTSKVKFRFFVENDPDDYVEYTAIYIVEGSGSAKRSKEINPFISDPSPNPASNMFAISYKTPEDALQVKIVIYNSLGNIVRTIPVQEGENTCQINISSLPPGMYFYRMFADGKTFETKALCVIK